MLALFQKDCMMLYKNNKLILILPIIFALIAGMNAENTFFAIYPPIVLTALSMTTLAYDENSKWLVYADTLPFGRKTIVASKYLMALIGCVGALALTALSYVGFGLAQGTLDLPKMCMMLTAGLLVGTINAAVMLPVSFRYGTAKGRIIYLVMIVLCCGGAAAVAGMAQGSVQLEEAPGEAVMAAVCVLLWAASYFLSVRFYEKREL